uniref:Ig-like domain-containing protein n=1 Tax=Crocodylus porosus TaxID=8502 RepID=A0A7M4FPD3_CROPO
MSLSPQLPREDPQLLLLCSAPQAQHMHFIASPTISIQKQRAVGSTETSLLCHVGGFYPRDVDAAWLRDGRVLGSTRSSPQRNLDGTFSLALTYTFTPQPLQADIALDDPGESSDRTGVVAGAVTPIAIILGAAGTAFYCWRRRRGARHGTVRVAEGREWAGDGLRQARAVGYRGSWARKRWRGRSLRTRL